MATISDLTISFTKMERAEQVRIITNLRSERRKSKTPTKLAAPKSSKRAAKKPATLKQLAALMTEAQKAELRKQLLGL